MMKTTYGNSSSLRLLVAAFIFLQPYAVLGYDLTSFFIGAHPDDAILFMNPNAYKDIKSGFKTIFITVTSGDYGEGWGTSSARESAMVEAVDFMVGNGQKSSQTNYWLGGRPFRRYENANTVQYFMRLPDSDWQDWNGNGYPGNQYQSLQKLWDGRSAITAFGSYDGFTQTTYNTKWDLIGTLRLIISHEIASPTVWVNLADPNQDVNPSDHPNHRIVGLLTEEALSQFPCINRSYWLEYVTSNFAENLFGADRGSKEATYAVVVNYLKAHLPAHTGDDEGHWTWTRRSYSSRSQNSGSKC